MKLMMKTHMARALLAGLTLSLAYHYLLDDSEPKRHIGDQAPQLLVSDWINGEAVDLFKPGHIYVIEFWATWCAPCTESIPYLSELNTQYKGRGVTFIGVNVREDDPSLVAPFIKEMGDKMNYRVAIDKTGGRRGESYDLWMSGQPGIPMVFVVDGQGRIAWIGHPMDKLEQIIKELISGTFDIKREAKLAEQEEALIRAFYSAADSSDLKKMKALVEELVAINPKSGASFRYELFDFMLCNEKEYDQAYAYLSEITPLIESDPIALNQVAWTILTGEGVEKRDLDTALKLSLKSNEIAKYERAQFLNTLARAYFERGETSKAIKFQTLVLERLSKSEEGMRAGLKERLEEYKAAL